MRAEAVTEEDISEEERRRGRAPTSPPPGTEEHPASLEEIGYKHVRTQPGWRRLPSGNIARRAILHGHRLPFKRRSKKEGFHQACSRQMDAEFVGERVVETVRMLRTKALVAAPVQDPVELVRRDHMITPSFMVKKKGMSKKRMVYNQKRCNREFRKKRVKLENLSMVDKGPLSDVSIGTCCIFKLCAAGGYCMLVNIYILSKVYIYKYYFQKESIHTQLLMKWSNRKTNVKKKATLLDNFVI